MCVSHTCLIAARRKVLRGSPRLESLATQSGHCFAQLRAVEPVVSIMTSIHPVEKFGSRRDVEPCLASSNALPSLSNRGHPSERVAHGHRCTHQLNSCDKTTAGLKVMPARCCGAVVRTLWLCSKPSTSDGAAHHETALVVAQIQTSRHGHHSGIRAAQRRCGCVRSGMAHMCLHARSPLRCIMLHLGVQPARHRQSSPEWSSTMSNDHSC